jgi:integrase
MLTALQVAKITAVGKHKDSGGLYLQVTEGEAGIAKSWLWRFTSPVTRKERTMGLGPYPDVSLAGARKLRDKGKALVLNGVDPIDAREQQKSAASADKPSFDDCAQRYIQAHEAGWRNAKHRQQWANTLRDYASPVFGSMPVEAISTECVLEALRPLWLKKPETASRVRQRTERVLAWAAVHGYRHGDNPARWRDHLDHLLPPPAKVRRVAHHAALAYADVPAFMARLGERTDIASKALAFTVLTACRTNEVLGAIWDEIDWEARIWTIPAARMKAGRGHRVPLSDSAMALLRHMASIRANEFVFPSLDKRSRGPLSNMAMTMVLRRMGLGAFTVHGFRSAFRDWCGEETGFPREICEAALAHALRDKTEAAYRRGDALERRRKLMEAWTSYCGQGAKVVALAALR